MRSSRALILLAGTAAVAVASCSLGNPPGSAANKVKVTSSDSACTVGATKLRSGQLIFNVVNVGTKSTEVNIYATGAGAVAGAAPVAGTVPAASTFTKLIGEVEDVAPGKAADLQVQLGGGTYEIACKPGQTGEGFRQQITVSGKAAKVEPPAVRYDRQVEVDLTEAGAIGLDGLTARAGESIEFLLQNKAPAGVAYLEIIGPDGVELGEITGVTPGSEKRAVIVLAGPGQYAWRAGDHATGTFTVD